MVQVVTLLLHQQRIGEALTQFGTHMRLFRRPPFTPPPAFAAAHWGWVSRQYAVMGELLGTRMDPSLLPAQVCKIAGSFLGAFSRFYAALFVPPWLVIVA